MRQCCGHLPETRETPAYIYCLRLDGPVVAGCRTIGVFAGLWRPLGFRLTIVGWFALRISTKLNLGLVLVVALVGCFGLFVSAKGGALLRRSIEQRSMNLADAAINEVDEAMFHYINDWRTFLESPQVERILEESNRKYDSLPDVKAHLERIDEDWGRLIADENGNIDRELLNEELSLSLKNKIASMSRFSNYTVFGEAMITNAYGANVAMVGKTTDFRQDDEVWWELTKENGLYVSKVVFDDSAGIYSIEICLRINDSKGTLAGVAKAVLDIRCLDDALKEFVTQVSHSEIDASSIYDVLLLDRQGEIMFSLKGSNTVRPERRKYANLSFLASPELTETQIRKDDVLGEVLAIRARSSGYGIYRGQRWMVVIEQNANSLLAPVAFFKRGVLASCSAIIILLAGLNFLMSSSISRRFRMVTGTMRDVCGPGISGDDRRHIGDELEELNTLTSYIAKSLHEVKAKNEVILASTDDAVIIFDEKGIINAVSVGTSRLFKYHVEEILGLDIGQIIPSIGDRLRETDGRAIHAHGAGRTFEVTGRKQNAEMLPLEVSTSQAQIERKQLFAVIGRNIESRKGAEEKLEATMAELKSFNDLAVGRELRMIALKEEVNELLIELGRSEKYETDTAEQTA